MKRLIGMVFLMLAATVAGADTLRVAATTSFHNSGLSDILLPAFKADSGHDVELLIVGTGQALRLGEAGDVDAVLVHAPAVEKAFIDAGHGTHRRQIMYNDFVIIGPSADPAGIADTTEIGAAMQNLAKAEASFVSRGDNSGTHTKERGLWADAGLDTGAFGAWYQEVGAGMGASLNTASGLGAYILSDRASWLNFGNKGDLALLFEGDEALYNQYSFIPVNPERHPHVKAQLATQFETWLTSPAAAQLINNYKIHGETLFTFNANQN